MLENERTQTSGPARHTSNKVKCHGDYLGPVALCLCALCYDSIQGTVHSLHHSITLGVVGRRLDMVDAPQFEELLESSDSK